MLSNILECHGGIPLDENGITPVVLLISKINDIKTGSDQRKKTDMPDAVKLSVRNGVKIYNYSDQTLFLFY